MDKEDHISQNPFQPYRPVYCLDLNKDTLCQWHFNFHMLFLFFTTGGSHDVMFSEDDSTGLHFPQSHSFQNLLIDDRMSVFKTDSQLENTSFPNIQHSKQPRRLHPIKTAVWRRFSSSLVIRPGDDITRQSESVVDEARPSPWSVCVWCDQAPHCLSAVQQDSTAATIQDFVSNISAAPNVTRLHFTITMFVAVWEIFPSSDHSFYFRREMGQKHGRTLTEWRVNCCYLSQRRRGKTWNLVFDASKCQSVFSVFRAKPLSNERSNRNYI